MAPAEGVLLPLLELAALMDRVAESEEEIARRDAIRRKATVLLDRVLALRHRVGSESGLLGTCHEAASALRGLLDSARGSDDIPDPVLKLSEGRHPLAALSRLAESDGETGDDDWSRLYQEVSAEFGRPLAAAAARGRLVAVGGPVTTTTLNGSSFGGRA